MPIDLIARATGHATRVAVVDSRGQHSYSDLLTSSGSVAAALLRGAGDLNEARVAFLVPPGFDYAATQWGVWRAGGIAVPLAVSHPSGELAHVLDDTDPTAIVSHPSFEARIHEAAEPRGIPVVLTSELNGTEPGVLPDVAEQRRAMILYTSGTTGKPKGVVSTHTQIRAQVTSLVDAWEWTAEDRVILTLPLHHVHGIINVLTCALWSGACCDVLSGFDARETWAHLMDRTVTLFMAVPTMYRRLISAWDEANSGDRAAMSAACSRLRLMVSGSAALPVTVLQRWLEVSGQVLLERYGMTEIGMALANPLHGERAPGTVGTPLPGVEARVVDQEMRDVAAGTPGELLIRGPNVFLEYWRRPQDTAAAFHDGWFKTGDIVVVKEGCYRILGRGSVDIIKTGGYKVSALEIEEAVRSLPGVRECAVVGVPDPDWGERVCVAIESVAGATLTLDDVRQRTRDRLAPYKIPKDLKVVTALPRNALGKVTKPAVAALFARDSGT
ncbi:MAG: acyl-CoA synthetase [Gemmatimonadota bacterium]|nr:MAG: acyl-CoA synthetase [Gemmatimonadota bacterium]